MKGENKDYIAEKRNTSISSEDFKCRYSKVYAKVIFIVQCFVISLRCTGFETERTV